jgi:hypothetical protein
MGASSDEVMGHNTKHRSFRLNYWQLKGNLELPVVIFGLNALGATPSQSLP